MALTILALLWSWPWPRMLSSFSHHITANVQPSVSVLLFCLQHIKNFKYLSCEISYEYEKDILKKILGIPNNTLNQLWPRNVQE
jgi:hypothetical protein